MEKAILSKEWIKIHRVFFLCLAVSVAMAVYAVLRMNRLIELKGAEHLWIIMLLKDNTFVDVIKWTPPFCGVAIALAQMLPEMSHKRLKLTLHLPYPQFRMILLMLAIGLVSLMLIYVLQCFIIGIYDAQVLVKSLVWRTFLTMLPWFFAGIAAYLFTAAVCIEGRHSRRIILALIGVASEIVFYEQSLPEAYNTMVISGSVFLLLLFILPLGSVARFKEGLQD